MLNLCVVEFYITKTIVRLTTMAYAFICLFFDNDENRLTLGFDDFTGENQQEKDEEERDREENRSCSIVNKTVKRNKFKNTTVSCASLTSIEEE
jgi:hypothetical protein